MKKVVITLASIGMLAASCYTHTPAVNAPPRSYNPYRVYDIEVNYANGIKDTITVDNFRSSKVIEHGQTQYQIKLVTSSKWISLNNVNYIKILKIME